MGQKAGLSKLSRRQVLRHEIFQAHCGIAEQEAPCYRYQAQRIAATEYPTCGQNNSPVAGFRLDEMGSAAGLLVEEALQEAMFGGDLPDLDIHMKAVRRREQFQSAFQSYRVGVTSAIGPGIKEHSFGNRGVQDRGLGIEANLVEFFVQRRRKGECGVTQPFK